MAPSSDPTEAVRAELEQGAELVAHGQLRIDAQQALAKLGRAQLADPYSYVLRLAEAGIRLGADALWFWTQSNALVAHFERRVLPLTLEPEQLGRLLEVLVSETPRGPERPALVQLAVAANAALSLGVEQLWIESLGEDGRGHRLELEHTPHRLVEVHQGHPGLWFRLRQPTSLARVLQPRPEREQLLTRAVWASTPIYLDNSRISHGFQLPDSAPIHVLGREIGIARDSHGFDLAEACVVLCSAGIEVERIHPSLPSGFFALVELDAPRDLSFTRFVRSPEFDDLLARVMGWHGHLPERENKTRVRRRATTYGKRLRRICTLISLAALVLPYLWVTTGDEFVLAVFAQIFAVPIPLIVGFSRARELAQIAGEKPERLPWSEQWGVPLAPVQAPPRLALPHAGRSKTRP